jgi:tetratricopeptide (TPR) repeat protein
MKPQAIIKVVLLVMIAVLSVGAQITGVAPQKPLSRAQIIALLAGDVPSSRVAMLVQERGIDFTPNDAFLGQIQKGGGEDDLVTALKSAHVTKAANTTPPSAARASQAKLEEAKQEELARHAAQGAEYFQDHHFAEAETEYRAAIKLDPQNSDLHMALARALNSQKKTEEGMREAHLAIRLNPESDMAHFALGNALRMQEDWAGAAAEFREAVRLNPNYDMTHNNLGVVLRHQNNVDGAIAEFRQALRLNPRDELAMENLGNALESKGDLDGAIGEYQQLARQRPRVAFAHFRLAQLLWKKGETDRALNQFRQAAELAPDNRQYQAAYEHARRNQ